jgi:hypothetical protein
MCGSRQSLTIWSTQARSCDYSHHFPIRHEAVPGPEPTTIERHSQSLAQLDPSTGGLS